MCQFIAGCLLQKGNCQSNRTSSPIGRVRPSLALVQAMRDYRLAVYIDATLEQQILDIAQRQREADAYHHH